ncbi:amidohydrolase [Bradyrhizobium sp. BWC-3-1]|uniref:amidohydrolase n=1 Tax=Bradyrhizobium sp. BWC-3-1 TaxID=3080012 RepID=UPI00293E2EA5|nr:amidohydrolase [Bradyrhizobium sp. BWC-3-1]WOH57686.1 amidohydrolase [Bradyrhizobium sp. BWC-3-1]
MEKTTIYRAKTIRTMNPSLPVADTVVVRGSRILEVGTAESVRPWFAGQTPQIDDTFRDAVLMPGFIDPHVHPALASILLPMHWITGVDWKLPGRALTAVRGQNEFLNRLTEIESQLPEDEPLVSWGYHELWHGPLSGGALSRISSRRPIVVWHRGFHSLYLNDAAMAWAGITREDAEKHPQVDAERQFFYESGMAMVLARLRKHLLEPERIKAGYRAFKDVIHAGGTTTIGDMAFGKIGGEELEWQLCQEAFDENTPFRVQMTPVGIPFGADSVDIPARMADLRSIRARKTVRAHFGKSVKLFADGGFFSNLMQLNWPGRIEGQDGHWITSPEILRQAAEAYWDAGNVIHIHTSADLGLELVLDTLEHLQARRPRFGRKLVIEHLGVSTPEQIQRAAEFGANASVNIYYVHELSDRFYKGILGYERASQMSRLGTLASNNIRFSLHSDFSMAPAAPLVNAWVAVNRLCETGKVMGEHERVSVEQAMKAITIDAAYILGMDSEVGSIRSGKKADFTVLDRDPFEVPPEYIREIKVLGSVFEGKYFPSSF